MSFVIADRIKETTTTTGTGTITLAGAVTGFRTFAAIGDANTTGYAIIAVDANGVPTGEWETGIGTYTAAGTTLSRGLIASSTGSLVSFAAGTKHVICCDIAGYTTPLVMATTANRAIQVADQTALGSTAGDARGSGAVDLQIKRDSSNQVASGTHSVVCGGYRSRASGQRAFVGGGLASVASGDHAVQVGGQNNTVAGGWAGNLCGLNNTVSANYATNLGGSYNTASGSHSITMGQQAKADKVGQHAHAAGQFAAQGDAQASLLIVRRSTTDATQSELFTNGSSARITIATDTTWSFRAMITARRTDTDNESAGYLITGVIDNNAGVTALVGTITVTVLAEDTAAWDVTAEADNTNDALVFKVTGEALKTIRWVGRVELVEVTG